MERFTNLRVIFAQGPYLCILQILVYVLPKRRPFHTCFRSDQSLWSDLKHVIWSVRLFATPWIAARQASLSITNGAPTARVLVQLGNPEGDTHPRTRGDKDRPDGCPVCSEELGLESK